MAGNGNAFMVKLAWSELWDSSGPYYLPNMIMNQVSHEGYTIGPMGTVKVGSIDTIQLMKSQNLANWLPVKSGTVGIKFSDLKATGMDTLATTGPDQGLTYTPDSTDPDNKGSITATLSLGPVDISGNYVVVASGLSMCALDTAGGLGFLLPGEDPQGDYDTYIAQAKTQRTKLWQTPNGGKLMDRFYDHNEALNCVYQTNLGLQTVWKLPDNKDYIAHTYDATQQDIPVNPDQGYNENAFTQQIALTTALDRAKESDTDQFGKAAEAVVDFKGNVYDTGNSMDEHMPMTVNQTFDTIANPPSNRLRSAGSGEMSEKEKAAVARVREIFRKAEEEQGPAPAGQYATMIQGTCGVHIANADLTLKADLDFSNPEKVTATVKPLSAAFPVTKVTIKNISDWTLGKMSSIGTELEQHYEGADSVHNFVHDKIQDAIESDTVTGFLQDAFDAALQKLLG